MAGELAAYGSKSATVSGEYDLMKDSPILVSRLFSSYAMKDGSIAISDPAWELGIYERLINDDMMEEVNVNDSYNYLPDKLSHELYGTSEMWPILLKINKARSRMEFIGPKIKIIKAEKLNDLLKIFSIARERIIRRERGTRHIITDLTVRQVVV